MPGGTIEFLGRGMWLKITHYQTPIFRHNLEKVKFYKILVCEFWKSMQDSWVIKCVKILAEQEAER